MTVLDDLYAAMAAAPEDDAARLRWYGALAEAELVLWLEREADEGEVSPRVVELEEGRFVLAFDGEDRLAAMAEGPVPYAALPGRVIAQALAGQGIGLAVNAETFLPAEAVDWLAGIVAGDAAAAGEVRPEAVFPPGAVPTMVQDALARVIGAAPVAGAWLVQAAHRDGRRGLMLVVGGAGGAEDRLARAIREALVFSGVEAGALDVAFVAADAPVIAAVARVGLAFAAAALPAAREAPAAPGMDPERPPKLR